MHYPPDCSWIWMGGCGWRIMTNNRVLRFDNAACKANGANADGVLGQTDFTSSGSDCTQNGMSIPRGVSGDPSGRLYVADNNNRILVFEGAAGLANGANAQHVLGQANFTTCTANTGGISAPSLNAPTRVFFDPGANVLWAADFYNNRVLMYGNTAEPAALVLGQPDFSTTSAAISQTGMNSPTAVTVDPTTGKVFVADESNNRVLRFASAAALTQRRPGRSRSGAGRLRQQPAQPRGTPRRQTPCHAPYGVSVDSEGRLWVADTGNNRLLRFDNASAKTNGAEADGVLGQPDFTSSNYETTRTGMYKPVSVFADSQGRLWVADNYNNRVLRFDNAAFKPNGAEADGVLGQADFTSQPSWNGPEQNERLPRRVRG